MYLLSMSVIDIDTERFVMISIMLKESQTRLEISRGENVWLHFVCRVQILRILVMIDGKKNLQASFQL
jgi:hypothetical protein